MSREVELKLTLDPKAAARVPFVPLLRTLATAEPESRVLKSTYFDTFDADLFRKHRTLRVRRARQGWVQTLDEDGALEDASQSRVESEHPVIGGRLDLDRIEDARLRRKLSKWQAAGELRPRFGTVIRRTAWRLETHDGALVECALDQGRLRTVDGRRSIPLCEVELVLKSGPPQAIVALARELTRSLPLSLEFRSQSERGYLLWRRESPTKPRKADALVLPADATAAEAMARIVESGSAHLQRNWQAANAASRYDPEHVHQMRVASRRLRTAFSVFGDIDEGLKSHPLVDELRWLADLLGDARNWDVLLLETFPKLLALFPNEPGLSLLVREATKRRRRARRTVTDALRSERYLALTLSLCEFDFRVREHPALSIPVMPFAVDMLTRRHRQMRKRARRLAELSAQQRHVLRITAKKLRYTAEFFGSLFAGGKLETFLRRFGELQKGLGLLNDLATTRELMSVLAASAGAEAQRPLGLCTGWSAGLEEGTLSELPRWWKGVKGAARFWPQPRAPIDARTTAGATPASPASDADAK
ncbi:MAG TPA: CHAD domain-containing protein [Burkholderiaceae bacterium]|nr:CHAD domain-containing protein [Burkholderiaceae bacterium]